MVASVEPIGPVIVFGRYRLTQDPLRLTGDGVAVAVGARALALLFALVEAGGRPVPFAELANRIWGRPDIEVNSVQAQVSALRRALGTDRDLIATMAGYGYRFTGTVEMREARGAATGASEPAPAYSLSAALHVPHPCAAHMPLHCTPFVGRYAELSELLGLMSMSRVITLVGAPGLGKTRLAHEVARRVATHFPDGIGSVTLSPHIPPDDLIRTLALALGIEPAHGWGTAEQFGVAIGARRLLLIVDCCQPLRGALGDLINTLTMTAPGLRVMVTGTEPLLIQHEEVVEVGPLGMPDRIDIKVEEALTFDAFRLLFTRLAILQNRDQRQVPQHAPADINLFAMFDLGRLLPDAVATAASVTRRLGGTPLAIELAASAIMRRMREGVPFEAALRAFATRLESMSRRAGRVGISLAPGAAIALMLELHHDAFDSATRAQLRRLGIFGGEFSRSAAIEMLTQFAPSRDEGGLDTQQIDARCEARLDDLLGAGLIEQFECEQAAVLRLPGAVKLFAIDALAQTNEMGRAAAAQARSLAARLQTNVAHGAGLTNDRREDRREPKALELELDALRAALKWAVFNDRFEIAVTLVEASAPLWRRLSLVHEHVREVRLVLTRLTASARPCAREEMRLWKSLECLPETWAVSRAWGARPPKEGIAQSRLKASDHAEA